MTNQAKQCPYSVYEFLCPTPAQPMCDSCPIFLESQAKKDERVADGESQAKENERIADGMKGYWAEQQNLSADGRG